MASNFNYLQCDIPEGMSIEEYKRLKAVPPTGYRRFKIAIRRFIRRGSVD